MSIDSINDRIEAVDRLIEYGRYGDAEEESKLIAQIAPTDYRGWMRLVQARTSNYKALIQDAEMTSECKKCINEIIRYAPVQIKDDAIDKWKKYVSFNVNEYKKKLEEISASRSVMKNKHDDLEGEVIIPFRRKVDEEIANNQQPLSKKLEDLLVRKKTMESGRPNPGKSTKIITWSLTVCGLGPIIVIVSLIGMLISSLINNNTVFAIFGFAVLIGLFLSLLILPLFVGRNICKKSDKRKQEIDLRHLERDIEEVTKEIDLSRERISDLEADNTPIVEEFNNLSNQIAELDSDIERINNLVSVLS